MIDWTEQERLLIIFHWQMYFNMKGSNTERHKALMHIPCAE